MATTGSKIEPHAAEDSTINMEDHEIEPYAAEDSMINMEDHEIEATPAKDSAIHMEDHEIEATPAAKDSAIHMEDHEIEASAAKDSAINMEDHEIKASAAKDSAINMEDHEIEASATEDTVIHMEDHEIEPSAAAEDHIPNEETYVDVDALLRKRNIDYQKSLRNKLVRRVKIPRVPKRLRRGKDDTYEPNIISFGPYHRGLDRLKAMEEHKERYLQTILLRCRGRHGELKKKIKELEGDVRRCYSKDIGGLGLGLEEENGEFLNMMMLDSCFIVEYLIRWHLLIWDDELVDMMLGVHNLVGYDMLLLENQLPFFLLEFIFNHVKEYQRQLSQFTIMDLCIIYIECMCKVKINLPPPNPDHLLHLYHLAFRVNSTNANADNDDTGTETRQETKENLICDAMKKTPITAKEKVRRMNAATKKIATTAKEKVRTMNAAHTGAETKQRVEKWPRTIPSATVLHEHGITFKKNEAEESSILDIKFHKGVLEIPPLFIVDSTNSLFRNLIAFEQLSPRSNVGSHYNFITYVAFLDFIINTPEDVALLCRKGILENHLGSDKDVADLFNNLTSGTFGNSNENYFSKLYKDMKEYQNLFWPRWRANLMRNYFNTPWAGLSVAAAVFFLVAAIAQTVFTGISTF